MASVSVGNWLGGYLPTWMGNWQGADPESSTAYGAALVVIAVGALFGLIPLSLIRRNRIVNEREGVFAPIRVCQREPQAVSQVFHPAVDRLYRGGSICAFHERILQRSPYAARYHDWLIDGLGIFGNGCGAVNCSPAG